jgi:glucokinase
MSHRAGVDLGGTKIQAVVVGDHHHVVGKARRATPTTGGPAAICAAIAETVTEAAEHAGTPARSLKGIGIGAPGAVDAANGTLAHAGNLDAWDAPYPLAETVTAATGAPVALGNDVAVGVLGELEFGAGRAFSDFIGIWWGTGVGGGVVLGRQLWRGRGAAGEIGHVVIQRGGRAEPRGLVGTMEAYAGRRNMEARARTEAAAGRPTVLFDLMVEQGRERLSSRVWADALAQGDDLAGEIVDDALSAIAAAAVSAVNLLDLEAVVLGGGLGSRFGAPMAERLAAAMAPNLFRPEQPPAVVSAELGDLGGAIGATLLLGKRHRA